MRPSRIHAVAGLHPAASKVIVPRSSGRPSSVTVPDTAASAGPRLPHPVNGPARAAARHASVAAIICRRHIEIEERSMRCPIRASCHMSSPIRRDLAAGSGGQTPIDHSVYVVVNKLHGGVAGCKQSTRWVIAAKTDRLVPPRIIDRRHVGRQ